MESNPFFHIEQKQVDLGKARVAVPKLSAIIEANREVWADSAGTSRRLREKFRQEKRANRQKDRREAKLREEMAAAGIKLIPERPEDAAMARNLISGKAPVPETANTDRRSRGSESLAEAKRRINSSSIFQQTSKPS
jgi:hypothetical protein